MNRLRNFIFSVILISIILADFIFILVSNKNWNETIEKIVYSDVLIENKEEYINAVLESRENEFLLMISFFVLINCVGIVFAYIYRKNKKLYEKTLYAEKEKAITTLKSIGDAVITIDEKSLVTFINPRAEKILAFKNFEVLGKHIKDVLSIVDKRTKRKINLHLEKVLELGKIRALSNNIAILNRKNEIYEIEESIAPIRNKEGIIIGAVFVFHDVTK